MCISKDLDEWTGSYICEVGVGIMEEQGRARGKKIGGKVQESMCLN